MKSTKIAGAVLIAVFFFCGVAISQDAVSKPAAKTGKPQTEAPKELNPFAPVSSDRDDAIPGCLEMSDGTVYPGMLYLTRDKRLQLYDAKIERQRQIPLSALKKLECSVKREWMEKEWRFKELASDEKFFTGREYPSREYIHKLTLKDGRTIEGPLDGLIYVQPVGEGDTATKNAKAEREETKTKKLLLHKRQRGEFGEKLADLKYVKKIEFGSEALESGSKKAAESTTKTTK